MDKKANESLAMRFSFVTILGNFLLTAFKLLAGIVAHSGAMISDAIHSASDVLSTFVVIVGVKLSGKESDKEHPFGHERFECVAALILSVLLAVIFYLVCIKKYDGEDTLASKMIKRAKRGKREEPAQ